MNEKSKHNRLQSYTGEDMMGISETTSISVGLSFRPSKKRICSFTGEKGKEEDNMSFVGILLLEKEAIAFGDSKSTVMDEVGLYKQQKGRNVQKVFKFSNENKLLVAFGNNEVLLTKTILVNSEPQEYKESIYLEDFINEDIEKGYTISNVLDDLAEREMHVKCGHSYSFIECGNEKGIFYIREYLVDGNGIHTKPREWHNDNSVIGYKANRGDCYSKWLMNYTDEAKKRHLDDNPEAFIEDFRKSLESKITEVDKQVHYNPVGLPLQIEVLKF